MTWHFRYDGPGFEVIALDSRTWRGFEPEATSRSARRFSDDATATLLTDEAVRLQIPEQPAIGVNADGVCFVIAAAPFIGYPIVESVVQPLINLYDIAKADKPDPPFVRWQRSFSVGRVARDPENWGFVPSLFEAVLARLSTRRRVVFLSGDVHYGFTMKMAYWQLGPDWKPRRPRASSSSTASSFRAQRDDLAPLVAIDLAQQIGITTRLRLASGGTAGRSVRRRRGPPLVPGDNPFTPHLQLLARRGPDRRVARRHPARPPSSCATRSGRGRPRPSPTSAATRSASPRSTRRRRSRPGRRSSWSAPSPSATSGRRRTGHATQLAVVDELHHRRVHQANDDDGKLARCGTASTASTRRTSNPRCARYIVAEVPMEVTEAAAAAPEPAS